MPQSFALTTEAQELAVMSRLGYRIVTGDQGQLTQSQIAVIAGAERELRKREGS
jgi:hypothetical protein